MDKEKVISRVTIHEVIAAELIATTKTHRVAGKITDSIASLLKQFFRPDDLKGIKSFRQVMKTH